MLVGAEVLRKVGDALGKHSYLITGGTGVLLVNLEVVDVDFGHCRIFSLVYGLIFRGCGKSTLRGAGIIPAYQQDARQISMTCIKKYINRAVAHFLFDLCRDYV